MLSVQGLNVSYGTKTIVRDIDFTLEPGRVAALIGPNGTGKSTLLKAMAGLLPHGGTVILEGCNTQEYGSGIAYMPQDTGAASSLLTEEVILLGRMRSLGLRVAPDLRRQALAALDRFGLLPLAGRTLDALSGGQRQLVFLAQSLFREPSVLLLDEPTAALDLRHQMVVLNAVQAHCRQAGVSAIVAVHDLNLAARYADSILCLSEGRLVAHGPAAAVLSPELIRSVYGVDAEVNPGADGSIRITALAPV